MLHLVLVLFFGLRSSTCDPSNPSFSCEITASYEKLGSNGLPTNVSSSDELICYYLEYSGEIAMKMNGETYYNPEIYCP